MFNQTYFISGEKMYDVSSNPSTKDFKDTVKINIVNFNEEDKEITFDLIGLLFIWIVKNLYF